MFCIKLTLRNYFLNGTPMYDVEGCNATDCIIFNRKKYQFCVTGCFSKTTEHSRMKWYATESEAGQNEI